MSTISDVARLAGVSRMTVSRVVNNSGYISQETRERVEQAISELGYVPNALARQLRFKQTKAIALVLTDITNPFFTTLARGVEDVAGAQGFTVMFCNTDELEQKEIEYTQALLQRQVDGVLLVPASESRTTLEMLGSRSVPVVLLDRRIESAQLDGVRSNSEAGAHILMQHLIELGHRRIAMLSGPATVSTAIDRVAGYTRACVEAGLEIDPRLVHYGEYTAEEGYRMARAILAVTPHPSAIFAANNFIAFGAIHALREAGLQVPEDMSVVAFDDLPQTWVMDPFLTVVVQSAYDIGRSAAELLLQRLSNEGPAEPREIILPTRLIIRKSSAHPGEVRVANDK